MCDPVSITLGIASASLAAGSAWAGISSANKTSKAMQENADKAAQGDYAALQARSTQINQKATQEALALKRNALLERGRLTAAQSETGFFGNSPLREMYVMRLKEKEAIGGVQTNLANALEQNTYDMGNVRSTAQSRFNEAGAMSTNSWAAGLQIAGAGLGGATSGVQLGQSITSPKKRGAS